MHALRYAYVDGDPEELAAALEALRGDAPPRGAHQTEAEAKKAADEKRALIEAALKLDGRKKKYKKQQEGEFGQAKSHLVLRLTLASSRLDGAEPESGKGGIQGADGTGGSQERVAGKEGEGPGCPREAAVN